ncbi:MAG TPA: (d)CMP kinase [Microthrixaceae bacterium]|jgi:cytidylate kinase|nr:(d)CMP kinase [Microthrixaceae bacterium]HMT24427.1 (d)CMP kinase [Microthrixaceae bacterium]HMT60801.1 (d)CMP kinase [Microthrixaceae bacterium]
MTVIALDGPAGSGKSTVARLVADRLGFEVLDTGAMYRAIAFAVLGRDADPSDAAVATAAAEQVQVELRDGRVFVDGADATAAVRGPEVSGAVSVVAAHPGVRTALRRLQRDWMIQHGNGVVEGRDIGTVVFPDAEVKVYLTASPEVRARRRAGDGQLDVEQAARNIEERDRLDSTREDSPLVAADDAVHIDTSELAIDEVVDAIVGLLR